MTFAGLFAWNEMLTPPFRDAQEGDSLPLSYGERAEQRQK